MIDLVQRLAFDATRCEVSFSKGVASNIEEAMAEIERLRGEASYLTDAVIPTLRQEVDRLLTAGRSALAALTTEPIDNCHERAIRILDDAFQQQAPRTEK